MAEEQDEVKAHLVRIDDELRALEPDDFARHYELSTEADKLRAQLAEMVGTEVDASRKEWAERAGRKGSHTVDPEELKAAIVSPGELGGSA